MKKTLLPIFILISFLSNAQSIEEKIAKKACECEVQKTKIGEEAYRSCIADIVKEAIATEEDPKTREELNTVEGLMALLPKVKSLLPEICDKAKGQKTDEKRKLFYSDSKIESAQNAYIIAKDFMSKNQYKPAIENFLTAIKNDEKFVLAYDDLAVCYRQLEKYNDAIKYYKKSLEIYPEGDFALMNIAVVYSLKSDFKTAIQYYEKLIQFYPENAEGYFGAGKNYLLVKNYEKALNNIFTAHRIYTDKNSKYAKDSEVVIGAIYQKLQEENKEDLFKKIAKEHNIQLN
jgi:tetratricopeptide (TPR) repeat protein